MNKLIEKISFLQDKQLKRWGKVNGYGGIVTGIAFIIAFPFVSFFLKELYQNGNDKILDCILKASQDPRLNEYGTMKIEQIAYLISEASMNIADAFGAVGFLFFGMGICFVGTGLCYLKCYELVTKRNISNSDTE